MRTVVWSFGGGVQSVAIAVYIARGLLPKPARVVMADTGRESSLTLDYTKQYSIPLLASLGLNLEIVPHDYATVDLYSHKGTLLIPAFTSSGKFSTYCSSEWKVYPEERYLREQGFGPDNPVLQWFGMSLDEVHRMRVSDKKWIKNHYPLCLDYKRRRHECVQDIIAFGLPEPPKSACWMCPNRNNAEWLQQFTQAQDDHAKAIALDAEIRERDALKSVYLHRSVLPLADADFSLSNEPRTMFDECANYCHT
jgi:hypothetical protein